MPTCPECEYDLRGQTVSPNGNVRCPECGLWFRPDVYVSPKARRRRRLWVLLPLVSPSATFLALTPVLGSLQFMGYGGAILWLIPIVSYVASFIWIYRHRESQLDRPPWYAAMILAVPVTALMLFLNFIAVIIVFLSYMAIAKPSP